MGRKAQIAIVVVLLLLIGGAVAAYAVDSSHEDEIADGIRIGDVDVGGMSPEEARADVRADLIKPLDKPVTVTYADTKYVLSPEQLNVDAAIKPGPASLNTVPGEPGRALRADELREQLTGAVQSRGGRTIRAQVDEVQPVVTTDELAAENPTYLTVDRSSFQLRLWQNLKLAKTYTVAVGAVGFDTPAGVYHIQNMAVNPAWNVSDSGWAGDLAGTTVPGGAPDNPLKARWMGIFDGAGIHGTDDLASLGSAASHGCVRMSVPDVIDLYDQVDVGTPIYIG